QFVAQPRVQEIGDLHRAQGPGHRRDDQPREQCHRDPQADRGSMGDPSVGYEASSKALRTSCSLLERILIQSNFQGAVSYGLSSAGTSTRRVASRLLMLLDKVHRVSGSKSIYDGQIKEASK